MKQILVLAMVMLFTGCGYIDRGVATVTGGGAEACVDNVIYLQFTSGVSVKYDTNGSIATCK